MPKIREFSCIVDSDVLEWIIEKFIKSYPNESAVFLFGDYWNLESRFKVPYITLAREPSNLIGTANDVDFSRSEFIRQTKLAAAEGAILMGWAHSHPWKITKPFIGLCNQSILDARTQITYRLLISLIVGVWENGFSCEVWKEGFAAPVDLIVIKGQKLLTYKQWRKQSKIKANNPKLS